MISVIVPVFNEEAGIVDCLERIEKSLQGFVEYEIIVVNDGSSDLTLDKVEKSNFKYLKIINHIENLGYGKSLYDGIMTSKYNCIAIIDGDGSYPPESIRELLKFYPEYDMIVGARQGREYTKGIFKRQARIFFKFLGEYASGRKVLDINSGLRIFKKDVVLSYKDSLCTGFSFTTTLTLIFLLNHYFVKYVPVEYMKRRGVSKVKHFKDTLRAAQIIVETILYYNPIKLFILLAIINLCSGLIIALLNHFIIKLNLLTIVSAICISSFIPIFCLGLLADQLRKIYNLNKHL